MSVVNAMIARGTNPGAGALQAAETRYGMDRDREIRNRNAFVQDRAFNAQQEYRNAALDQRSSAEEAQHERWVMSQIQQARSPEQARAIYEWGIQDAQKRGFDVSQARPWEEIAGLYVQPQAPDDFGNTVFEAQDAQGNRIYAQPGGPTGYRTLKGISPPGPSAKDLAAQRAAEANARTAETKAEEAEFTAEQKKATKTELQALASSFLTPDGLADSVKAVYGSVQGVLPSLRPEVVDAEAQIDRLVDMLTLENTSKMTGVLSESDIKILARAGSVLANKRVSEKVALNELRRIAEVVGKTNKVGRFEVEEVDANVPSN